MKFVANTHPHFRAEVVHKGMGLYPELYSILMSFCISWMLNFLSSASVCCYVIVTNKFLSVMFLCSGFFPSGLPAHTGMVFI